VGKSIYAANGIKNVYSCKITNNATQSVGSGSWVQLTGLASSNTGGFDVSPSSGMSTTTTNAVVIQKAGYYFVCAYTAADQSSSGICEIRVLKNSTSPNTGDLIAQSQLYQNTDVNFLRADNVFLLAANDVLRLYTYQSSGSNRSYGGNTDRDRMSLTVIYLNF
jgi:hypothetical protein